MKVQSLQSLEILDSRGNPTVRTFVKLADGSMHSASVPSGASTGTHEAVELRDNDPKRYGGKGVLKAVKNVNTTINKVVSGMDVGEPRAIDKKLIELDGTENKAKLGANAIFSVSMAVLRAAAHTEKVPLWKFIHKYYFSSNNLTMKQPASPAGGFNNFSPSFPRLMINIVNGGKHANWTFDIQEFMVIPTSNTPSEALRVGAEIFHSLGKVLKEKKLSTLLGDEGGFSPALSSNEEVLEGIILAAKKKGFENGKQYNIGLDCAATEWWNNGKYISHKTNKELSQKELIDYYKLITNNYKLLSIEDPFAEDDWNSWQKITGQLKDTIIIGDDLYVTNPKRIKKGIKNHSTNAVLIKVNQIGTVAETVQAIQMTKDAGWKVVISHRSGETEDAFIADLAYACAADFIKTGSTARSERLCKYNRLLEIEKGL